MNTQAPKNNQPAAKPVAKAAAAQGGVKAKVNPDLCVGCGTCAAIAPDIFEMSAEGKAQVKNGGVVADNQVELLDRALSMCPTGAISKEE
ncbi:MAG TPA: ferredoxin [bacterium]|nr:ferredoxin [bacterium]